MYVTPQTLTVARPFTADRVKYEPGQVVDASVIAKVRSADMLLSLRFLIPTVSSPEEKPETDEIEKIRQNFKRKIKD